jgi:glycosyltransferase involved in cell wall biosynthesis
MTRRIVHVISEYSAREAMGRTVTETARRVEGEHHLVTTHAFDGGDAFAGVHELGGRMESFPVGRGQALAQVLDRLRPDVVHLHAGALGPMLASMSPIRSLPLAMTIYAWPTVPSRLALKHAGWSGLRQSNVLPTRVLLTSALPAPVLRATVRRLGPLGVLTPDPRVSERLGHVPGVTVERLPSGAPVDPRRASFDPAPGQAPTVVFAGRAESVRGVGTLLDAFPSVLARVPDARLRLLLIPRPELPALLARAHAAGIDASLDVVTEPVPDLLADLASAQVGCWPFLADYTTSPPAMALAEGMAVGLPVVSTPVACVRAVMRPDVDGLAITPGDHVALASALTTLLTDRAQWERYAAAALAATAHLTWDDMAAATERVYARRTGTLRDAAVSESRG